MNSPVLKDLKRDLERILVRHYIRSAISNYDEDQIYIIYDTNRIEIYDKEIFDLKRASNQFTSHLISRPIRVI